MGFRHCWIGLLTPNAIFGPLPLCHLHCFCCAHVEQSGFSIWRGSSKGGGDGCFPFVGCPGTCFGSSFWLSIVLELGTRNFLRCRWTRSRSCGLCGDLDAETTADLKTPQ